MFDVKPNNDLRTLIMTISQSEIKKGKLTMQSNMLYTDNSTYYSEIKKEN